MGVCIYITYQIKKCVYIIKKSMCIYVCVWGCLDKYISVATWPPKQKFLAPPLHSLHRWHWVDLMAKIITVYHAQLYHPFPMSSPPLQIAVSSFHSFHWSIIQFTLILWVDLHWILVLVWCSPVIINKDNTTLTQS